MSRPKTPVTISWNQTRPRAVLLLLLLSTFIVLAMSFFPRSTNVNELQQNATETKTSLNMSATPSPTPLTAPDNLEQTNGIILGGVLLVLIILGGTISVMRRSEDITHKKED